MLIVGSPELVRRQAMPVGAGAMEAIVALLGMVVLLATGSSHRRSSAACRRGDRARRLQIGPAVADLFFLIGTLLVPMIWRF